MQKFANGQEVEVRTVTCGAGVPDRYERMEYIGPWRDRHACHRIDHRGEHQTFYANDGPDNIRPVRRTVLEIAADHKWREDFPYHVHANVTAVRLDAIRTYAREHHEVDLDD